jgi:N-succinyldiaminopimelate aminotransferase
MPFNRFFQNLPTTLFERMTALSNQYQAVNLGQGFPDDAGHFGVREKAAEALLHGYNQYPPMMGWGDLRQAVAEHDTRFYGVPVQWNTDVLVTAGATEALASSVMALINQGDEVIIFEPFFDAYLPLIRMAGGVPRILSLKTPCWSLDLQALKEAITEKTRLIILNNPLNPTGRVYSREELTAFAECVKDSRAYVISDEVYEHMVYDGVRHVSLLEIEALKDRVVKISSAGKTFSLTGLRVGYITASAALCGVIAKVHQFLTFAVPPALQQGVAFGLRQDDEAYTAFTADLQLKRDHLCQGLKSLGFHVLPCQGTYFASIDLSHTQWRGKDLDFAEHLVEKAGVASIPYCTFSSREKGQNNFLRFCFAKQHAVLDQALERLAKFIQHNPL